MVLPSPLGANVVVVQPNLLRHKIHTSSDGKVTVSQVLPPSAPFSLTKPMSRVSLKYPKHTSSFTPSEKYFKSRFRILEGERILKIDQGIPNPDIRKRLVINSVWF